MNNSGGWDNAGALACANLQACPDASARRQTSVRKIALNCRQRRHGNETSNTGWQNVTHANCKFRSSLSIGDTSPICSGWKEIESQQFLGARKREPTEVASKRNDNSVGGDNIFWMKTIALDRQNRMERGALRPVHGHCGLRHGAATSPYPNPPTRFLPSGAG